MSAPIFAVVKRPGGVHIPPLGFLECGEYFRVETSSYDAAITHMLATGSLQLCTESGEPIGIAPATTDRNPPRAV